MADSMSLTTSSCQASQGLIIKPPLITSHNKCKTVSTDMDKLYLDGDAISIMSSIPRKAVKYHEETSDFQNGNFLAMQVIKGLGATMKPPPDATGAV
jgi:hypothetical protein